jgi:hypothetical protein
LRSVSDSFPRAHPFVEGQIEHCENGRVDLLGVDAHGHLGDSCDAQRTQSAAAKQRAHARCEAVRCIARFGPMVTTRWQLSGLRMQAKAKRLGNL